MRVEIKCDGKDKANPDFPCDISLFEEISQMTEVYPFKMQDGTYQLDYGYSEYIDTANGYYYCDNCNKEFTYQEVIAMIQEEEE